MLSQFYQTGSRTATKKCGDILKGAALKRTYATPAKTTPVNPEEFTTERDAEVFKTNLFYKFTVGATYATVGITTYGYESDRDSNMKYLAFIPGLQFFPYFSNVCAMNPMTSTIGGLSAMIGVLCGPYGMILTHLPLVWSQFSLLDRYREITFGPMLIGAAFPYFPPLIAGLNPDRLDTKNRLVGALGSVAHGLGKVSVAKEEGSKYKSLQIYSCIATVIPSSLLDFVYDNVQMVCKIRYSKDDLKKLVV